jgi:hypothetical protein
MIDVEGRKFRVLLGTSPEEVEQWRQDRRKRFPSLENIQRKKKEVAELIDSGAVQLCGVGGRHTASAKTAGVKRDRETAVDEDGTVDTGESLDPALASNPSVGPTTTVGSHKRPCSHFAQGRCEQGDKCKFSHEFEPRPCNFFARTGRCKRGSRCSFLHDKGAQVSTPDKSESSDSNIATYQKEKERAISSERGKKSNKLFLPKPLDGGARGTLLRNLLKDQILSENNRILQCLRFMVREKFFSSVLDD